MARSSVPVGDRLLNEPLTSIYMEHGHYDSLSEFLLQGPICAFVGTTVFVAKWEDVAFIESLGIGTC